MGKVKVRAILLIDTGFTKPNDSYKYENELFVKVEGSHTSKKRMVMKGVLAHLEKFREIITTENTLGTEKLNQKIDKTLNEKRY